MSRVTLREWLEKAAFPRAALENFLNPRSATWAKRDPVLGYIPSPVKIRDGIDDSRSVYSYETSGERLVVNYRGEPCRIHTYGDSMTQCHQVSDGETWQEYLAAHLREPIRNFGMGGWGVYQAYRRMKRVESGDNHAPYVVLNIYSDDHRRSVMANRWMHLGSEHTVKKSLVMFQGTPWAHVRLDLTTGQWVEVENPFNMPESLFQLCEPDFVYETYRHDPIIQLEVLRNDVKVEDTAELEKLARYFEVELDLSTAESARRTATALFWRYAFSSSKFVIELICQLLEARGQKLMIMLSYGPFIVLPALGGELRFDRSFVEYLQHLGFPVFDALEAHRKDFQTFRLSPEEYVQRYWITKGYSGHYGPAGNHWFAFAAKNAVVGWLNPKPPAYRGREVSIRELAADLAT